MSSQYYFTNYINYEPFYPKYIKSSKLINYENELCRRKYELLENNIKIWKKNHMVVECLMKFNKSLSYAIFSYDNYNEEANNIISYDICDESINKYNIRKDIYIYYC